MSETDPAQAGETPQPNTQTPDAPRGETKSDRSEPREIPPPPGKRPFVIAGLLLAGLLCWGGYGHWQRRADAAETQRKASTFVPKVRTAIAQRDDKPIELTLPGGTRPFATASILARATGYVAERSVDIGSRVRQGDLLLRIAAPDIDQQLAQAEAQIGQLQAALLQAQAQVGLAVANANLANVNNTRASTLATKGYETQQNADAARANQLTTQASVTSAQAGVQVAEANLKAQTATVRRLAALVAFETIRAPFTGVITTRNIEVGDLVNADASSGTPLLAIDRDDVLRVTVNVPQNVAAGLTEGVPAVARVPQMPGREFKGTVTRNSSTLLTSARTLTTEVDIPNPDGALRAGLFVNVTFSIPRAYPQVVVPAETLVFNQKGPQVVVVLDNKTARFTPVVIDKDLGAQLALRDGLEGGETVILSPPTNLRDGAAIETQEPPEETPSQKQASRGQGRE